VKQSLCQSSSQFYGIRMFITVLTTASQHSQVWSLAEGPPFVGCPRLLIQYRPGLRFQNLIVASMKMAVFLDVSPCSLVQVYRSSIDGGSRHLWNVGKFLRDYTVQPRRQLSWIQAYSQLFFIFVGGTTGHLPDLGTIRSRWTASLPLHFITGVQTPRY
jgi:hypothetical protein